MGVFDNKTKVKFCHEIIKTEGNCLSALRILFPLSTGAYKEWSCSVNCPIAVYKESVCMPEKAAKRAKKYIRVMKLKELQEL
jgi:hypothetical protein